MESKDTIKVSAYIALACLLQISENCIPNVFPGIKIGLSNIVTIIAIYKLSYKNTLTIAALRPVLASILTGTFLAPNFIISFSASLASAFVMLNVHKSFEKFQYLRHKCPGCSYP
jgi:heptaprenyl diphosphate synthase